MSTRSVAGLSSRRVMVVPLILSLSVSGETALAQTPSVASARADVAARCGVRGSASDGQCVEALRRAANAGDSAAMAQLGWRHLVHDSGATGAGRSASPFGPSTVLVTPDNRLAEQWFRKAAALGDANAMTYLGWMYSVGHGVPQDSDEAIRWLRLGAEAGSTRAMEMLGVHLLTARSGASDDAAGERWLRQAANAGDRRAMASLATVLMSRNGAPRRPPNWNMMSAAQQRAWLTQSARTPGDDPVGWLRKACVGTEQWLLPDITSRATPGRDSDAVACYELGMLYTVGEMGVVRDSRAAVACFDAVEQSPGDQFSRDWYEVGNGRPQTIRQAAANVRNDLKAAEARFAELQARERTRNELAELGGLLFILFILGEAGSPHDSSSTRLMDSLLGIR